MINCAIYPRKSKQVDSSDSMEAQVDMCIRYLDEKYGKEKYNVTIYDGDYGITGHSIKRRKDFQRMMQDVSDKKIQLVVIQRYDRIARNTRDFCNLYHNMEINGCNLVSVSQQIDTSTPYGRNFMYMQASMAELEWALNSERRKDANKYARSIGKCTLSNHSIPYGYKAEYIDGIRRMVKDPEKEDIVNDIYDYYKNYSNFCATAKYVNKKHGTTLSHTSVRKVIRGHFYYGHYDGNDSFCEPYINKEEWDKLQLHRAVIRQDPRKRTEILFTGLIRCPECHKLMRSIQKTKPSRQIFRYYNCEYHAYDLCSFRKVKSEILLEKMLIDYINQYISDLSITITEEEEKLTAKNREKKVKQLQAELERLNFIFLKGRMDEKIYDLEYLRIESEIASYKNSAKAQERKNTAKAIFIEGWEEGYKKLDKLHRKLFWKNILAEIIVDMDMNVTGVVFL